MRSLSRAVALLAGAALAATLVTLPADARKPTLSGVSLTEPKIHAVGVKGTGLPKKTHLLFTLSEDSLVRIRVKDTNPYGLSRAFNRTLPAGPADVPISARVDGTKLPPGKYLVVVKAHSSTGSSPKYRLHLRIVGKKG